MIKIICILLCIAFVKIPYRIPLSALILNLQIYKPIYTPIEFNSLLFIDTVAYVIITITLWVSTITLFNSHKTRHYIIMSVLTICTATFLIKHIILFYIFFEIAILPIIILIIEWGYPPERISATIYIISFTIIRRWPFLIICMYKQIIMLNLFKTNTISTTIRILLLLIFLVKTPIFLLHTWLPKAHVESPTVGSALLAGIYLKLGYYGSIRTIPLTCFSPLSISILTVFVLRGGVILSILIIKDIDMKFIVAISSVIHITASIILTLKGRASRFLGLIRYITSHRYVSAAIFYLVGQFTNVSNSRNLLISSKLTNQPRLWSVIIMPILFANLGIPPFLSFHGECLLFTKMLYSTKILTTLLLLFSLNLAMHTIIIISLLHNNNITYMSASQDDLKFRATIYMLMAPCTILSTWIV